MPFLPMLIGCCSWPWVSGMKAGSPMPVSTSMTCVVGGLAIGVTALSVLCGLRGVVDRCRQIHPVFVNLRQATGKDARRHERAQDPSLVVEALVLADEDVLH